jgi:hypothetical protein
VTGALFGSILLGTVVAWIFLVRGDDAQSNRPFLRLLIAVAPPLLFGSVVWTAFLTAPAGEYRAALEAVSFAFPGDDVITVGGGTDGDDADDLIVRDLPPRYLTFRREGDAVTVHLPPELADSIDEPTYAAVRVDKARPFANSVLFPTAGEVLVGGRRFDVPSRTFGAAYPEIPRRVQEVLWWSIPIRRNLTAEITMYPLRFWVRPEGTDEPAATAGTALGSFISSDGGFFRSSMYATLVGDGTTVRAGGGEPKRYETKIATIEANGTRHFALFRLDYADPARGDDARSAAQERRSFGVSFRGGRLSIVYDTPDIVRLEPDAIAKLLERQKEKDAFVLTTRDPRRNAPMAATQMVLSFRQLGPRIQNEFYSAIRIAPGGDCALRVTTHTGTRCYDLGDAFTIGDEAAAVLRVTRIAMPWAIVAMLFGLFALSIGYPFQREQSAAVAIVISAAELLLAVRLLVAFQGGILDASAASALWESVVAYALLPLTLRVGWLFAGFRTRLSRADLLNVFVRTVATAVLVAIALWRAQLAPVWIGACVAAVVVIPFAVAYVAPPLLQRLTRTIDRKALIKICLFGIAIALVRIAMWLGLGWKERISIGSGDLAVTVLYLPVVLLFFALLWQRHAAAARSEASPGSVALAVIAVAIGIVLTVALPFAVRDSGSAFVHLPAILLLFTLPLLARPAAKTWLLAMPLAALAVVHVALFVVPHVREARARRDPAENPGYRKALASETAADEYLTARLEASTNDLRIMSHVSPHQLAEAGTSRAEGLVVQRRMLDRYSGRGWLGAGFLHVPLAVFGDTHLNDNLSAIHILAPFGIIGGAGILALLVALAALPLYDVTRGSFAENRPPEEEIDTRGALGILSLWTFCIAGIYMFAANVGLVLFTGKNVYLLAAASKSDAVEGGVLLLLGLLAFTRQREAVA